MADRKKDTRIPSRPSEIQRRENENESIDIHPDRTKRKHDHYPKETEDSE